MQLGLSEVRTQMSEVIDRVADGGERVVLQRRGKCVAAIVSLEDLARLEAIEDAEDAKSARAILAEMKRTGEKPIPLADVKRRLGM